MKRFFIIATAALCVACNNVKQPDDATGADSLAAAQDSSAIAVTNDDSATKNATAEGVDARFANMQKVEYYKFFKAEITADSKVACTFQNTESEDFEMIFGTPKKGLGSFNVQTQKGKPVALHCEVIGGGVDPYLFIIMEGGSVEWVSLYDLSQGQLKTDHRSETQDVVGFKTFETDGGTVILGVNSKGEEVDL